ncbi:hypothetical protein AAXB25_15060 [Paenibacillus lautus]|uniref:hypothetical protein n=1 Tax=Paenibacillus lautus TaxID=1401 RepID=UPI003D2A6221
MDLRIDGVADEFVLEVGDIVEFDGDIYILMEVFGYSEETKYELRTLDGTGGAVGRKSLQDMKDFVKDKGLKVYNSNYYELVLKPKK